MLNEVRRRLTYANVMATVAVFVAMGGVGYAAATLPVNSVGTQQVVNDSLRGVDIRNNDIRGIDIRDKTITGRDIQGGTIGSREVSGLTAQDFAAGALIAGPPGPQGLAGPQGPKGDTGTVDTTNFYDKAQSDGRYLATTGTAADADKLDGLDSTALIGQSGALTTRINAAAVDSTDNGIAVRSYGAVSGLSTATGAVSSVETLSPARTLIARDLAMTYTNTAGAGNINVVLMIDGVDTDYRCAIAGPAESSCTNTGEFTVPAGSRLAFQVREFATGGAGTNAGDVMVGIRLTSP